MNWIEKINWTLVFGIFAGLIAVATSLASWSEKKKQARESELNKLRAEKAQADIKTLQLENLNKADELLRAYKKISDLQDELKNEITGGNNKPILRLTTSKLILDNRSGKKYFILFFDILNSGKYALQNMRATVYDNWGGPMLKFGVKHFRDGLSFGTMQPTSDEISHYNPTHHFDNIGAVPPNNTYPLYTTTFSEELSNLDNPGYTVETKWYNGAFTFFIHLKVTAEIIQIEMVELTLNGEKIDYRGHFEFNK
jgi:hypothetical protein